MGVLARQSARSRVVAKSGHINTVVASSDGKQHRIFRDIFITLLDLGWPWMFMLFAAAFYFRHLETI